MNINIVDIPKDELTSSTKAVRQVLFQLGLKAERERVRKQRYSDKYTITFSNVESENNDYDA